MILSDLYYFYVKFIFICNWLKISRLSITFKRLKIYMNLFNFKKIQLFINIIKYYYFSKKGLLLVVEVWLWPQILKISLKKYVISLILKIYKYVIYYVKLAISKI